MIIAEVTIGNEKKQMVADGLVNLEAYLRHINETTAVIRYDTILYAQVYDSLRVCSKGGYGQGCAFWKEKYGTCYCKAEHCRYQATGNKEDIDGNT